MKKTLLIFVTIFCLTGCFFDFHTDSKYAESAINAWFSYKNDMDDLGATRRRLENISEIKSTSCKYKEHSGNKYIYKCKIVYTPIGETVIPLSKAESKNVYVALTFGDGVKYKYRVYLSSSEDKIWTKDENLRYGE